MKASDAWNVLQHDPIQKLSDSVWRVEGALPKMALRRVMTVVRRPDGDLAIHNGIAVDDATREEIEAWGRPRWLLVPNGWHRLDAPAYRARYPDLSVLCPAGARKKVAQVVDVDGTYDDFPSSEEVRLETLHGTKEREGALIARDAAGATLVLNDVVFNQPHLPGLFGAIYKMMGQSGRPKITFVAKRFMISDKKLLSAHLHRLADEPELRRIIVSHINPIEDDPAAVLHRLADEL